MKKKELGKGNELIPLNENLYSEFSLEKLEERMETDPLTLGSMFGEVDSVDSTSEAGCFTLCIGNFNCTEH